MHQWPLSHWQAVQGLRGQPVQSNGNSLFPALGVMAITLPISGREKFWPIISRPPDLEKE